MSTSYGHRNSAELEREVEAQRRRVEQTISEIQGRLSPGELLDQALSYTRNGGGKFAANLGHTVTANPVPVTLLGVSLAWLMAGSRGANGHDRVQTYPLATTSGTGLQRVSHTADTSGDWYSEFVDDSGRKYRALADESGKRIGHFTDETGKMFSGFVDDAGNRVQQFRDEAGNAMDSASGWASHTWHDLRDSVTGGADAAARWGGDMQHQANRMGRSVADTLQRQPLIAGALAFAAGAAVAAALPHTREEDEMFGDSSDRMKRDAGTTAGRLYDKGREQAADLYEDASEKAEDAFEQAKSTIAGDGEGSTETPPVRH